MLIWLMIYPMMLKIVFASIARVGKKPKGLFIRIVINWLVKPFSMAFFGWLFFRHLFLPLIGPELASQYIAGVIILAAAPCTAMVFVWFTAPALVEGGGTGEVSEQGAVYGRPRSRVRARRSGRDGGARARR